MRHGGAAPLVALVRGPDRLNYLLVRAVECLPDLFPANDQHVAVSITSCFHRWAMSPKCRRTQSSS